MLWSCLKLAGAEHVEYYIPHRVDEGYGLNGDAIRSLAESGDEALDCEAGAGAIIETNLADITA